MDNDARGMDFPAEFLQDMEKHEGPCCGDSWKPSADDEEEWHCTREAGHPGNLHIATALMMVLEPHMAGLIPVVGAIWHDTQEIPR